MQAAPAAPGPAGQDRASPPSSNWDRGIRRVQSEVAPPRPPPPPPLKQNNSAPPTHNSPGDENWVPLSSLTSQKPPPPPPDPPTVATAASKWRQDGLKCVHVLQGHTYPVNAVAWQPGASKARSLLATSSWFDGSVRVWELRGGQTRCVRELCGMRPGYYSSTLAWSPDGDLLAVADFGKGMHVVSATTWNTVAQLTEQRQGTLAVAWCPQPGSTHLALGSGCGDITVWDANRTSRVNFMRDYGKCLSVISLAYNPTDPNTLASGAFSDKNIKLWDVRSGRCCMTLSVGNGTSSMAWCPITTCDASGIKCISWSPCGTQLVSTTKMGTTQFWDLRQRPALNTIDGKAVCVSWAPSGNLVAVGMDDMTRLWCTREHRYLSRLSRHGNAKVCVAGWSPSMMHLATGASDTTVQVWAPVMF